MAILCDGCIEMVADGVLLSEVPAATHSVKLANGRVDNLCHQCWLADEEAAEQVNILLAEGVRAHERASYEGIK